MTPDEKERVWHGAIEAAQNEDIDGLRACVTMRVFDPNRLDERGRTLLHHAVEAEIERAWTERGGRAHVDCTAYLLTAGVDFTIRDQAGQTPADIASESGHWLAESLLCKWAQLDTATPPLGPSLGRAGVLNDDQR